MAVAVVALPGQGGAEPAPCPPSADLGTVAFVRDGRLTVLDLDTCRTRLLAAVGSGQTSVRWSADGLWLSLGGRAVPAAGGRVRDVLPGATTGVWSPRGHVLAGATRRGGLVIGGPDVPPRRLLPDGWGAGTIAFSPSGRTLAVARSLYLRSPPPYHQEVWLVAADGGARPRMLFRRRQGLAPPELLGFSPDGRWVLFWEDIQNSASLRADGLPLVAVPVTGGRRVSVARSLLVYGDFFSWCRGRLVHVRGGGGRRVTLDDGLVVVAPPSWRPADLRLSRSLSWNSPACSPDGRRIATAAGPSTPDSPFGQERRSIWLLGSDGTAARRLTTPAGARVTDELPRWSRDGRWLAFVRTRPSGTAARGELYLLDVGRAGAAIGPIADLGTTGNYYGHYGWAGQVAWHRG